VIFLGDLNYQVSAGGKDEDAGGEEGLEDTALERSGTTLVQTEPLLTSWKAMEAQSC
jgi:hypothetical protein